MEKWKEFIKGYEVSDFGNVRSYFNRRGAIVDVPHMLKQSVNHKGRPVIKIRNGSKNFTYHVSRLVLEVFVGKCPIGMQCCHWDDNSKNNKLSNLRWDTWANNVLDGLRNKTAARGERQGFSKLTEEQVIAIRERYASGEMSGSITKDFGVDARTIRSITSGNSWKDFGGPISPRNDRIGSRRISQEQIVEIKERRDKGETFKSISKDFGVSDVTIRNYMSNHHSS